MVKILLCGDSGAGKTGSLASLVGAGYQLRILDLDAGVETLAAFVNKLYPDKLANVEYEVRRDVMRSSATGMRPVKPPTAFIETMELIDKWTDGTKPSEWGQNHVLVVDTLSALSRAAYYYAERMNPGAKDNRQIFFAAQRAIEAFLGAITDESFRTNVILCAHMTVREDTGKAFPASVGQSLDNKIASYFNSFYQVERLGVGDKLRRVIRTYPTGALDLKSANMDVPKEVPIDSGLATIFKILKQ
jgi:hypothetical protein